jgi:uncharacterized protein DUF2188
VCDRQYAKELAMTELIEVRCTETGTWGVIVDDADEAISTHISESAAERAAREQAAQRGARVIMHDRYQRIHEVLVRGRPRPTQPPARSAAQSPTPPQMTPTLGDDGVGAGVREASPPAERRGWLLGLEPIFEGGWLHKGRRARAWEVEDRLVAVALFGDVTVALSQARRTPAEVTISAWAIFRDVDVTVAAATEVELSGTGFRGDLSNLAPAVPRGDRQRRVRIHGHALLGDVTVRGAC